MTPSWTWIPNALCVFRVLLVAPLVVLLIEREYTAALALMVLAGASDALDGFLARKFDCRTRLGSLLDPAADKLLLTSVFVSLTVIGLVPLAMTAIVVLRDVVIVFGALAYHRLIGPVSGAPTAISKLNTACQLGFVLFAVTRAAYGLPPGIVVDMLGAAVVFTTICSGTNYVLSWSRRAWRATHAAS
ncbi:CDP-alcohol phosphatidyltransferase family protein [Candidatus Rariloculus sp.]|uniref:CDP-alcohol phosphatidyltransferase family protein n=1 Tax=Candidatus Rariloculus sp. TaxID=3101265 RepID=UPI003D0F3241